MKSRIITGFSLLGLGLFVIIFGKVPFFLFLGTISVLLTFELCRLYALPKPYLVLASVLNTLLFVLSLYFYRVTSSLSIFILPVLMCVWGLSELYLKRLFLAPHPFVSFLKVILWVTACIPFLYFLRDIDLGLYHCLFLCGIIWASDTGAYFAGKFFGRHLLTPISPKKTREGLLGGILFGMCIALIFGHFLHYSIPHRLFLSLVITLAALGGDIHESLVKRHFNVKDSGSILPGHGGIYDRIDSFQFVLPLYFFLIR